jgi:hypothetical protein
MAKIAPKARLGSAKIVIFPTFDAEGLEYFKKMEEWCEVVDFEEIVGSEARMEKFHSDLLSSCLSLKKTVPSYIASNIFANKIEEPARQQEGSKVLVLKGLPQDLEQLKIILSRSESIGMLGSMFV